MAKKNESQTSAFIQAVRDKPCLFDRRHESFRDQAQKQVIWSQLAADFDLPDAIAAAAKWRNLRDTYMKAKKKATADQETRWMHYEEMNFLDDMGDGRESSMYEPLTSASVSNELAGPSASAASVADILASMKAEVRETPSAIHTESTSRAALQGPLYSILQVDQLSAMHVDEPTPPLRVESVSPKRTAKRPRPATGVDEPMPMEVKSNGTAASREGVDEESWQFGILVARKLEKIDPSLRDVAQMEVLKVLSQYRCAPHLFMQNLLRNLNSTTSSDADSAS